MINTGANAQLVSL